MLVSKTILTNKSIKMKWISIKDELPKDDGMYMTFTKSPRTESIGINMYDSEEKQFPSSFTTHWMPLPPQPNEESNVSSQEPSIEEFRDKVLKVICENRAAIIRASNDRMTALEVFETKNCFAAVINTYEDLFEIITVLKPNGDQTVQEPEATASKEIGEPLVQNKSNQ